MSSSSAKPKANRLIREKSPYLLQHAYNPVDWYPWGNEAFAKAKAESKPIFLSVGYSSCHWCHVMESESFENPEIAALLNADFVAIKVDREERPDIDEIYMTATQLFAGQGDWPNSVWLTPDGKPWYAGTYFNPEAFKSILGALAQIWRTRRADVESQSEQIAQGIRAVAAGGEARTASAPPSSDLLAQAIQALSGSFDELNGGFGGAPKFPPHSALRLLFHACRVQEDAKLLHLATRTLDAMMLGGIHDHVGGGFHRYSTDARWFLPHFEKMLYDNAQLARAYADAYAITRNEAYRDVAARTLEWVLRDMTGKHGAFYSAVDADSEGEEGKFYLWTRGEILDVLGPHEGELFSRCYGVEPGGNFKNEASGKPSAANILHLTGTIEEMAAREKLPADQLRAALAKGRDLLLARRATRVRPRLDDKVLTSWNGLMISGLATAGRILNEPRYTAAAETAAAFILGHMQDHGRLLHAYRDGSARIAGYLEDYAYFSDGLLDLYEATQKPSYLSEAARLTGVLEAHYMDAQRGAFFHTADDQSDLLARMKDPFDGVEPSGNGVAAQVLVRLGRLTGEGHWLDTARKTLDALAEAAARNPQAVSSLLVAEAMSGPRPGTAGTGVQPEARIRKAPVTMEAFVSLREVSPGESFEVSIRLVIDPGWHIVAHAPHQSLLIPTTASVKADRVFKIGELRYPRGQELRLPSSKGAVSVYQGTVEIRIPVEVASKTRAGKGKLVVDVQAQACDDSRCLSPETYTLSLEITVRPRGTRAS